MHAFMISMDDSQEQWDELYSAIECAAARMAKEGEEAVAASPSLIYLPGAAA
jgi:hypothetical protein